MKTEIKIVLDFNPAQDDRVFAKRLSDRSALVKTLGLDILLQKTGLRDYSILNDATYALLNSKEALDYLQVAAIGDETIWCIDDGEVITWMLPSDY